MKISGEKYDKMFNAIKTIVEVGGGPRSIKEQAIKTNRNELYVIWLLWYAASDQLIYDDTHPWYVNGQWTRWLPYDPTFDVYSDGVNDLHIETALKSIATKLGIIPLRS